jgi:hypothetical protein
MTGRDDFRSSGKSRPSANPGLSEDASPYAVAPRSVKTLDEATLKSLTDDCSKTVKAAIDAHLDAGRTVHGATGSKITSVARTAPR